MRQKLKELMEATMTPKFTAVDVAGRMDEAVRTLRRLPKVKVTGYFNSWPDHTRSIAEQLQAAKVPMKMGPPTADAITRMEECLDWMVWLDDETERLLVWMRAENVAWKLICRKVGFSRTKAWRIYTMTLLKIATHINAKRLRDLHV